MTRVGKRNYYLDIAEVVLERGTCLRRNYGAVVVKNDQIISSGYTGAPRARGNCTDIGTCMRKVLSIPRGERYELCRSVHAEANAIIHSARKDMLNSTLYLVGKEVATLQYVDGCSPCSMCKRLIINAGIVRVVIRINRTKYVEAEVDSWELFSEKPMSKSVDY
ncbi:MAG: cytidine deaminase [Oscillospiraceae bacterium]|nr:cytidine deaminase [Oscillospiraceae bacterium]